MVEWNSEGFAAAAGPGFVGFGAVLAADLWAGEPGEGPTWGAGGRWMCIATDIM